jgi:Zn-dependent peptidase ImmA (M78 family)
VTFIPERRLENRASELWRRHRLHPGFDMEQLFDALGLSLLWDDLPIEVLGALKPEDSLVILNQRRLADYQATPGLERFTGGHEIGHWVLHSDDARSGVLPMLEGGRTWCRDGSQDSTELQANLFSSFLLMPTDQLNPCLPPAPWRGWPWIYRLAETFGVSATAMIVRLERAGWAHRDGSGTPVSGQPDRDAASGQTLLPLC